MQDVRTAPELGILSLVLTPLDSVTFRASPARSLNAALLRRLELVAPEVSQALHNVLPGASSSDHPWTISPLLGPLERAAEGLTAVRGRSYRVRVTGLLPRLVETLHAAFDPEHPLGREPLLLEHVPFAPVWEETRWERLTVYASLLTAATPRRRIALEFRSPTGFRSAGGPQLPAPRLCLEGYLRKWNAFSSVAMPEASLLNFIPIYVSQSHMDLRPAEMRLGRYSEQGVVGRVEWLVQEGSPVLLRLVNALADYAEYCGTGMKTAQGMGQTVRVRGSE